MLKMSEKILNQNNIQLIDGNYRKDSFDRFGDDLCELIISFLSIDDKKRHECISKQWQRLIFNKQHKVKFTSNPKPKSKDEISVYNRKNLRKRFEVMFRKFIFIKEIHFISDEMSVKERPLHIMTKNCKYLERLVINRSCLRSLNGLNIQSVHTILGPKLKYFSLSAKTDNSFVKCLFDFMTNIVSLHFYDISVITSKPNNYYSKLEEIYFENVLNYEDLKTFTDSYYKQIKKICLKLNIDKLDVNNALKQLSRFENVNELSLKIDLMRYTMNSFSTINTSLEMIANQCTHLESLRLEIIFHEELVDKLITGQWFHILGRFRALKRLRFALLYKNFLKESKNYMNTYLGTIESLKECHHLKHLFLVVKQINDDVFGDISQYLPQLMSFRVVLDQCVITDLTLHFLAKLKHLYVIEITELKNGSQMKIYEDMCVITDEGVCDLINHCSHINTIKLDCDVSYDTIITSIQSFINRYQYCPQIKLNFELRNHFNDFITANSSEFPKSLQLKFIEDRVPDTNNLSSAYLL